MRRPSILLVVGIVVLAGSAALRLTGLDWLLPSLIEQDAHIPAQVRLMEDPAAETVAALDWGAYPHLVARLTQLFTTREDWAPPARGTDLATLLARARWPVLRVRLIVALLSILAVPATWLLARRWLGAGWSWLAAALMGTSLLAVHFAGQARAHGAAAGLMALAVVACLRLRRRGDAGAYALAGLAVGAAIGCLQSGLATLIPLVVAHAGATREQGGGLRRHALLAIPLACVALALVAFYPFAFQSTGAADASRLELEQGVLEQAKHHVFLEKFNGLGFLLLGRQLWTWEPALALGALGGAAVWCATRWRPSALRARAGEAAVVLSFACSYGLAVGLYQRSYERFMLPLIPFLCVLASWGVARICEAVRPKAARRAVGAACVAGLLAFPTAVTLRLAAIRLAPDTIDLAARWIEERADPGARIVVGRSFGLPLYRSLASQFADTRVRPDSGLGWLTYQRVALREQPGSPAWNLQWIPFKNIDELRAALRRGLRSWIESLPAELCVNEVYTDERGSPEVSAMTTVFRTHAERLARFSPDGDGQRWEVPLYYQDETTGHLAPMAWRVLHAERLGPVIEVYRLHPVGTPAEAR